MSAQNPPRVTSADLRIALTAVKSPILVGEFTKVKAEWQVLRQIGILWESEDLLIDDRTGYREHVEGSGDNNATVAREVEVMAAGDTRVTERVIGIAALGPVSGFSVEELNASFGFAFSRPGTYSVKMRDEGVESNPVSIQVVEPTGADAAVLAGIRANMGVFTFYANDQGVAQQAETLFSTYAGHKYLAPLVREFNGRDDYLRIDQATLDRRSAFDFSQTAFAADEALLQARVGRELFGEAYARPAFQRVVQLYPGREAALLAAVELRRLDDQPPVITVTAAPSGLWPPNNKMIAVRASPCMTRSINSPSWCLRPSPATTTAIQARTFNKQPLARTISTFCFGRSEAGVGRDGRIRSPTAPRTPWAMPRPRRLLCGSHTTKVTNRTARRRDLTSRFAGRVRRRDAL